MIEKRILEQIAEAEAITEAEAGNVFGSEDRELERLRDLVAQIKDACQKHTEISVTLSIKEIHELRKIEAAAKKAYAHLSHLDNCGVLTDDDEPMMQALREALKPGKQRAIAEIAHSAGYYD